MKCYEKPFIEEEEIEIEDICANSTVDGNNLDPWDIWDDEEQQ